MRIIVNFLAYWLWVGFCGGAAVLLVVATPLEARLRQVLESGTLNIVLALLALAWVLGSGFVAWRLARRITRPWLAHAAGAVLTALTFVAFLMAGSGPLARFRGGETVAITDRFVFGPYPDAVQVARLEDEGYTGIVTLLSSLVPFEAVLLERERAAAEQAGLRLIEAPMLPWVTDNAGSLEIIRNLARQPSGKYYLHCYLGRHRVDLARYAILQEAGVAAAVPAITLPAALERGPLLVVSDTLVLGPMPARDEWFEIIVRGGFRRVYSLLEPANPALPGDRMRFDEESGWAKDSGIELINRPVAGRADAEKLARELAAPAVRTYVHGFAREERVTWLRAALAAVTADTGGIVPAR